MHHPGKLHAVAHIRRTHAEEEGVRALVSQQKRAALLVRRDDPGRQAVDALLAKKMMRDKCRHKGSPFMDTEGASFRDNVHASIMPRRPIIKRRHVFFVLEAAAQGGPGPFP